MITLAPQTVRDALDAMYWNFSPYLDNDEIEQEHITDLIDSYNQIVNELSPQELEIVNRGLEVPHQPIFY